MEVDRLWPRHARGLSLIQLMTTVAVGSSLLAIGAPAMHGMVASATTSVAARGLHNMLAFARAQAINRGRPVTLCPTADGTACSNDHTAWHLGAMVFLDRDADRERDSDEPLLRRMVASEGVAVQGSRYRRALLFRPDGMAWGSNVTLRVCSLDDPKYNRAIVVYGTGRARITRTMADGSPVDCG